MFPKDQKISEVVPVSKNSAKGEAGSSSKLDLFSDPEFDSNSNKEIKIAAVHCAPAVALGPVTFGSCELATLGLALAGAWASKKAINETTKNLNKLELPKIKDGEYKTSVVARCQADGICAPDKPLASNENLKTTFDEQRPEIKIYSGNFPEQGKNAPIVFPDSSGQQVADYFGRPSSPVNGPVLMNAEKLNIVDVDFDKLIERMDELADSIEVSYSPNESIRQHLLEVSAELERSLKTLRVGELVQTEIGIRLAQKVLEISVNLNKLAEAGPPEAFFKPSAEKDRFVQYLHVNSKLIDYYYAKDFRGEDLKLATEVKIADRLMGKIFKPNNLIGYGAVGAVFDAGNSIPKNLRESGMDYVVKVTTVDPIGEADNQAAAFQIIEKANKSGPIMEIAKVAGRGRFKAQKSYIQGFTKYDDGQQRKLDIEKGEQVPYILIEKLDHPTIMDVLRHELVSAYKEQELFNTDEYDKFKVPSIQEKEKLEKIIHQILEVPILEPGSASFEETQALLQNRWYTALRNLDIHLKDEIYQAMHNTFETLNESNLFYGDNNFLNGIAIVSEDGNYSSILKGVGGSPDRLVLFDFSESFFAAPEMGREAELVADFKKLSEPEN